MLDMCFYFTNQFKFFKSSSNKKVMSKNVSKLPVLFFSVLFLDQPQNFRWKLNPKSKNIQTDASCTKLAIELCCILIILTKLVIYSFLKAKQSTCQILNT